MNTDERLAVLETKIDELIKQFTNHLRHHFIVNMALLAAILGLVTTLLLK
jgi:hypothetical protein